MNFSAISNGIIALHRNLRTAGGDLIAESLENGVFTAILTISSEWSTYEKVSELTGQPIQWVLIQSDILTPEQSRIIAAFQIEGRRYEVQPNEPQQVGAPNYWRFACQPIERL